MQQIEGPSAGQFPDDAPPASQDNAGGQGGGGKGRRKARQFDVVAETRAFYAAIDSPKVQAEIKAVLPDTIDIAAYVRVAKTAATSNPDLLNPEWRGSLMRCLAKAAGQGLLPDGKEGALIARWDDQAHAYQVCWQPMVWGITKLGRLTGQIKKIYAALAFDGEDFRPLGGEDEGRIIHTIDPRIVDEAYSVAHDPMKFLDRVTAAYCIITTADGEKVARWMPRSRLMRVRATSKAAKGPWNGPFQDEMMLKAVILWTAKWLDLNTSNPATARFREALETDMEADFDHAGNVIEHDGQPALAALPASAPKLDNIMDQLKQRAAEKVAVGAAHAQGGVQQQTPVRASTGGRGAQPADNQQDATTAAHETRQANEDAHPVAQVGGRVSSDPAPQSPAVHETPRAAPASAAPVSAPTSGDAAARAFVAEMKQEIRLVASRGRLDALFAKPRVKRRNDRLMESFPDLHTELTAARSAKEQEFGPPDTDEDKEAA